MHGARGAWEVLPRGPLQVPGQHHRVAFNSTRARAHTHTSPEHPARAQPFPAPGGAASSVWVPPSTPASRLHSPIPPSCTVVATSGHRAIQGHPPPPRVRAVPQSQLPFPGPGVARACRGPPVPPWRPASSSSTLLCPAVQSAFCAPHCGGTLPPSLFTRHRDSGAGARVCSCTHHPGGAPPSLLAARPRKAFGDLCAHWLLGLFPAPPRIPCSTLAAWLLWFRILPDLHPSRGRGIRLSHVVFSRLWTDSRVWPTLILGARGRVFCGHGGPGEAEPTPPSPARHTCLAPSAAIWCPRRATLPRPGFAFPRQQMVPNAFSCSSCPSPHLSWMKGLFSLSCSPVSNRIRAALLAGATSHKARSARPCFLLWKTSLL